VLDVAEIAMATIVGARAIHANAGYPNFGKLAASRAPDRRTSGKPTA
jgi:hypothetical protein